ncbi:RNA polymerase sigma factor [Kribbella monticola]|uniref:RNA polymerase sigma factor n=1 Tax=Kribbella monticola TaxID=2185285 RepID=UPI000DD4D139|nr:sigma-70 family RNA polymerase sigma factor [Kribbella monticola]
MTNSSRAPDREARFSALYRATYADLVRFAQRRVDHSHAEDVVAEAFLVAWRRLDDLPKQADDARAWLFGVARHTIMNSRRGSDRRRALAVRLATSASTATDGAADLVAQQVDLAAAWNLLSEVHQEALALAVLDELTAPQAAVVLGISPVAFRLRLSRARRALRAHLDHRPEPALAPASVTERQSS